MEVAVSEENFHLSDAMPVTRQRDMLRLLQYAKNSNMSWRDNVIYYLEGQRDDLMAVYTNASFEKSDEDESWSYARYHAIAAAALCSIGVLSNLLFLSVLLRTRFRTANNQYLAAVAVMDAIVMILYIAYSGVFLLGPAKCGAHTFTIGVYGIINSNLSVLLFASSCWTLVGLGIHRLRGLSDRKFLNAKRELKIFKIYFACVILTGIVLSIPGMSIHTVNRHFVRVPSGCPPGYAYNVVLNRRVVAMFPWIRRLSYAINGVIFKAIPSLALLVIVPLLIGKMKNRGKSRLNVAQRSGPTRGASRREARLVSVNRALLFTLVIFLITQLPNAIVNLLCVISSSFFELHATTGELQDLLSILNMLLGLPAYCLVNSEIRHYLQRYYIRCALSRQVDTDTENLEEALNTKPKSSPTFPRPQKSNSAHGSLMRIDDNISCRFARGSGDSRTNEAENGKVIDVLMSAEAVEALCADGFSETEAELNGGLPSECAKLLSHTDDVIHSECKWPTLVASDGQVWRLDTIMDQVATSL